MEGDPLLLRRAVGNLLANAVDFSPNSRRVTIELRHNRPRTVKITVRAQGPGNPEYADDKAFERFYSLARPHSQKKSTGLGLAFVKEIARLHGGYVTLRNSVDGAGAITTLDLPRSDG